MRLRNFALLLLAAAAAAALWSWGRARHAAESDGLQAGTVEARSVRVGSLLGGRVREAPVREGDWVRAGQVLARLDAAQHRARLDAARAQVAAARAALAMADSGPRAEEIRRAAVAAEQAESERARAAGMLEAGVCSQEQYDRLAAVAESTRALLEELRAGTRAEEVERARAELAQAEAAQALLEEQEREYEIRSPCDGVLTAFDLVPGALLAPNQPAAEIRVDEPYWVRVYVAEPEMHGLRLGQAARVLLDGREDAPLDGRVTEIADVASFTPRNVQTPALRADQYFAVKVTLASNDGAHPGMAARVRLAPATTAPAR